MKYDGKLKGPDLPNPRPVDIAYKTVYGQYEYNNNFLKRFENGFEEGVKYAQSLENTKMNIDKQFDDWFTGQYGKFSFRCEHFYGDVEIEDLERRKDALKIWLLGAFQEGYETGFTDATHLD